MVPGLYSVVKHGVKAFYFHQYLKTEFNNYFLLNGDHQIVYYKYFCKKTSSYILFIT